MVACSSGEAETDPESSAAEEATTTVEDAGAKPNQQAVDLCHTSAKTKIANPDTAVFGEAHFSQPYDDDEDSWMVSGSISHLNKDGISANGIWQCRVKYDPLRSLWITKYISVMAGPGLAP